MEELYRDSDANVKTAGNGDDEKMDRNPSNEAYAHGRGA